MPEPSLVDDPLAALVGGRDLPAVDDGRDPPVPGREVTAEAQRLGRALGEMAEPGDVVAVAAAPSWRAVAAVHAVLGAGLVYLPLPPAGSSAAARAELAPVADIVDPAVVVTGGAAGLRLAPAPRAGAARRRHPGLAYVVRSSGSTGTPKLVAHDRRSLAAFLTWARSELALGPEDRVLNQAAWTADISLLDLLAPAGTGASLVLAGDAARRFPAALLALARDRGVTVWQSVPTTWRPIAAAATRPTDLRLRLLILTAEPCPHAGWVAIRRWLGTATRLLNVYGSSEANDCSVWEVTDAELARPGVSVGRPVTGFDWAVVDQRGVPVAEGDEGELVVWGPTVMAGYLGDPERTLDRTRPLPGAPVVPGVRPYWTGDRARAEPGGRVVLTGRFDRLVKVHGQWVDLDAVERAVATHPSVGDAAVEVIAAPTGPVVAAAVAAPSQPDLAALDRWCRARLRSHEVPVLVHVGDALPRAAAGKVARAGVRAELARRLAATNGGTSP